jgi:hypothetical protein
MRHDVTFPFYVDIHEIYNLACPPPIHYQFDPVQTTKTSVHGAINMLGLREGKNPSGLDLRGSMATRKSTRKSTAIGEGSTRWGCAPAMTRADALRRLALA